ncbi:MAG: hypothetical protein ACYDBB_07485 [Armatimonadota bacterium]
MDITPEETEYLNRLGTFYVDVYPGKYFADHVDVFLEEYFTAINSWQRVPPHRLVIEPLVAKATTMRIYGNLKESPVRTQILSMGTPRRGYLEVDLSREVVKGFEAVWNLSGWERGSIVLGGDFDEQEFGDIVSWCGGPEYWSSLYQITKGTSAAAIRYAQSIATAGATAFSFSASNGIDFMDIFPPPTKVHYYYKIAKERCRLVTKWVEYPPDRKLISVDDPEYISLV